MDPRRLESASTVPLVIIDAVKGCCDSRFERPEWGLHFSKVRDMLPKINSFAKRHRDNGGKVIWVEPTPWTREYLEGNIIKLYEENPDARFYVEDHIDEYSEFPMEIRVEPEDTVLSKNSYSAFINPRLSELVNDSYMITGFYADGCVNATIIEGWSRGLFTYIISDLVESMDSKQDLKRELLEGVWPHMYGHVIPSSMVMYD